MEGRRPTPGTWAIWALIAAYAVYFSWLSIQRHQAHQTQAMDLGYTTQAVWNTRHGRLLEFSTYENAPIDLPLDQFQRTDILLAYHAEFLLVPISLLYWIWDSPITLLVLQSVGLSLGAWAAFAIAREQLDSEWAGVAFGSAYLLAPALQGANYSDFHAVALTASILLFAMLFLLQGRHRAYIVCLVLAMLAKEDIPVVAVLMGLYAWLWLRKPRLGLVTVAMGAAWFLVDTQVVLPAFSGLRQSPFLNRLAIFGPTLKASWQAFQDQPTLVLDWLSSPEIRAYLAGLLASFGFLSLLHPVTLAMAGPVVAVNVFSNWSWTHSEGAHYSASVLPFLVVSAILGTRWLAGRVSSILPVSRGRIVQVLSVWVLVASLWHQWGLGLTPLARDFAPPRVAEHHRLGQEFMALIPDDASLSAQTSLYPHLAHREEAYLFPAVNEADYIFLDVTDTSYPISPGELRGRVQGLLEYQAYGVLAAEDGYLLLQHGAADSLGTGLPQLFYDFATASAEDVETKAGACFGDQLELLGATVHEDRVVHAHEKPVWITTHWQALQPLRADLNVVLFFTRDDGAVVGHYAGGTPTTLFHPTSTWKEGTVYRVETPSLPVGQLHEVLLAVVGPGGDEWVPEDRLGPVAACGDAPAELFPDERMVKLLAFQ